MKNRSWLLVPGNSEKRLGKAMATGADNVIVDLEDTVPLEQKRASRAQATEWLSAHRTNVLEQRRMGRWVRIAAMDATGQWREDLIAVMRAAPDGIVLPRAAGPEEVRQLAAEIYELEQVNQIPANTTQIIPLVGDTPRSAITIGQYLDTGHQRLVGLAWSADSLTASIAATRSTDAGNGWTDTFRFVRAQTLLTAHACELMAIDAPFTDLEDEKGLAEAARGARADGFSGMLAVHPDQIAAINEAFTPSDSELREARDIVAAFEANPNVGSLQYQGRVIDRPHLTTARRILGLKHSVASTDTARAPILRPA